MKGGGTGCKNLEEGGCELRVTDGIDENVTLVWVLISEDPVVTTFPRLETASAEELLSILLLVSYISSGRIGPLSITLLNCDCKYSCIRP